MGETREDTVPFPFPSTTIALKNFEYPLAVQTSILLCLLIVVLVLSKVKQLFKNTLKDILP